MVKEVVIPTGERVVNKGFRDEFNVSTSPLSYFPVLSKDERYRFLHVNCNYSGSRRY